MLEWIRQRLERVFGFRCSLCIRYVIICLLLIVTSGAAYLTLLNYLMPFSAILAMIVGGVLILFLCMDSFFYYLDLLHSSPREVLPLARSIDPLISRAISVVEEYVKSLEGEKRRKEIESQA